MLKLKYQNQYFHRTCEAKFQQGCRNCQPHFESSLGKPYASKYIELLFLILKYFFSTLFSQQDDDFLKDETLCWSQK